MAVKKVKDKRSLAKNWQQTKLNLVEKRHQFPHIISDIWICLETIMTYSSKGYYIDDKPTYDIIKTSSHISGNALKWVYRQKVFASKGFVQIIPIAISMKYSFLQGTRIYLDNPRYKSTFVYEDECKLH